MDYYRLIIGDKHLSSWSLRVWLLMRHFGLPFEEVLINLDQPDTHEKILQYSAAGRVPILILGEQTIWDSLAIIEFLAEAHPDTPIWPRDAGQRAVARAAAAEMHAGFADLRHDLSFDVQSPETQIEPRAEVRQDIDRICQIWRELRARSVENGEFLFGSFCAADAMFAPVAVRFHLYGIAVDDVSGDYADALLNLSDMQMWLAAAAREIPPDLPAADEEGPTLR